MIINATNFTRWITAMESDWAQSRALNPNQIAIMLAKKDNARNVCSWLGFDQNNAEEKRLCDEVFYLMFCTWDDSRDKMVGRAAQLREWCHKHAVRIGEVAA
jgi:hypothetical protein